MIWIYIHNEVRKASTLRTHAPSSEKLNPVHPCRHYFGIHPSFFLDNIEGIRVPGQV